MASKHPKDYTQAEVNVWLNSVGLGSKIDGFVENSIDGSMLVILTEADLTGDLGLSGLQARKFLHSLEFATSLAEGGGGDGAEAAALRAENAQLKEEIANLRAINRELQDQLEPPPPRPAPVPAPAPPQPHRAPAPAPKPVGAPVITGAAGGALRGATLGAIGGAIAGDPAKGAAMGAAMGAAGGGMQGMGARRRARLGQRY